MANNTTTEKTTKGGNNCCVKISLSERSGGQKVCFQKFWVKDGWSAQKLSNNNQRPSLCSSPAFYPRTTFGRALGDTHQQELNDERSLRELSIWPESCAGCHTWPLFICRDQYVRVAVCWNYLSLPPAHLKIKFAPLCDFHIFIRTAMIDGQHLNDRQSTHTKRFCFSLSLFCHDFKIYFLSKIFFWSFNQIFCTLQI